MKQVANWNRILSLVFMLSILILSGISTVARADRLPVLRLAAPPGPICYPLAYMAEYNTMSHYANRIVLKPWRTYDQLMAIVTSKSADIVGSPITNAIMMYNKGVPIHLVNVGLWGMLYIVTSDQAIHSLADLKYKTVSVNHRGGNHDLILRHLLLQNGLTPDTQVKIIYLKLPESSAKLVTGDIRYALLNEPRASIAFMGARKAGVKLYRPIDLQLEWSKLSPGAKAKIPQAGFISVEGTNTTPQLIEAFNIKYAEASKWVNSHPKQAGRLVQKYFSFMKAKAVQKSLTFARLEALSVAESRPYINRFYNELLKTAPARALVGKLPNEGFYYKK